MAVLPRRLAAIAALVDADYPVADIGCDHGLLSAHLAAQGCPCVYACDISDASVAKAQRLAHSRKLANMHVRHGDGLAALEPGDAPHTLVLGGMGGGSMAEILRAVPSAVNYLVLSPHGQMPLVYSALAREGFAPVQEGLVGERRRIYRVILAGRGPMPVPADAFDREFGPLLPVVRPPLYARLLTRHLALAQKALCARQAAGLAQGELEQFVQRVKEELSCL